LTLIIIDGLDASGKDTQAQMLSSYLKSHGKTVLLRFHPSDDNFFGLRAKHFLTFKGKKAHLNAALFYMLDVIRSIILYSWRRFDYVIFVRYLMGTAYLPSVLYRVAYHFFATFVPKSKFMFFLDVSPEEAYRRVRKRGTKIEMFESPEEFRKVREKALALALENNWKIINSNQPALRVQEEIRKKIFDR